MPSKWDELAQRAIERETAAQKVFMKNYPIKEISEWGSPRMENAMSSMSGSFLRQVPTTTGPTVSWDPIKARWLEDVTKQHKVAKMIMPLDLRRNLLGASINPENMAISPGQRGVTDYPEDIYKWWAKQAPDPQTGRYAASLLDDPILASQLPKDIRSYLTEQDILFNREMGAIGSTQRQAAISRWGERLRQQRQSIWEEISPETFYEKKINEEFAKRARLDPWEIEYLSKKKGPTADYLRSKIAKDISLYEREGGINSFLYGKYKMDLAEGDWYMGRPSRTGSKVIQPKYLSLEQIRVMTQQEVMLRRVAKSGKIGAAVPIGSATLTGIIDETLGSPGGPFGRLIQASPRATTNRLFHLWSAAGNDLTSSMPQVFTELVKDNKLGAALDDVMTQHRVLKGTNLRTGFDHTNVEKKLEKLLLDMTGSNSAEELERIAARSAVSRRGGAWGTSGRFAYQGPIKEDVVKSFQESLKQVMAGQPAGALDPVKGYTAQLKYIEQYPAGTMFRGKLLPGGGYEKFISQPLEDPRLATVVLNPRAYLERIKDERIARATALGGDLKTSLLAAEKSMESVRNKASRSVFYGDIIKAYTPDVTAALAPQYVEVGMVRMPWENVKTGQVHRYRTELFTAAGESIGTLPAGIEKKFEEAIAKRTGDYGWMEKETAKGLLRQKAFIQVEPKWMKHRGRWNLGYKANLFLDRPRLEKQLGKLVVTQPQPASEVVGLFTRPGIQEKLKSIYMGQGAAVIGEEKALGGILGKRFPVTTFEQLGYETAGVTSKMTKGLPKIAGRKRFDLSKMKGRQLGFVAMAAAGALLLYQASRIKSRRLVTPDRVSEDLYGDTPTRESSEQMPVYNPQTRVTMTNMTPEMGWDNRVSINMGDKGNNLDYSDIMKALQTTSRSALDLADANVTYNVSDDSTKMNKYTLQRKVSEYFNR